MSQLPSSTIRYYKSFSKHDSFQDLTKMQKDYCSLSQETKVLIREIMEDRFEKLRLSIDANYSFLGQAAADYAPMFTWRELVWLGLSK